MTVKKSITKQCDVCNGTGSIESIIEEQEKVNHVKRNRKRMAWLALTACVVVVYLMMFEVDESRLPQLNDVMTWFFLIMGSIVASYMGFSTFEKGRFSKTK